MPRCRRDLIEALEAKEQEDCFDSRTVAKEQGKEFRIENNSQKTICRVRIDDCLIKGTAVGRCDYLFKICETERYLLVELKGSDIISAFSQIISTFNYLKNKINVAPEQVEGVIVSARVPHAANKKVIKLKKQCFREYKLSIQVKNRRASLSV